MRAITRQLYIKYHIMAVCVCGGWTYVVVAVVDAMTMHFVGISLESLSKYAKFSLVIHNNFIQNANEITNFVRSKCQLTCSHDRCDGGISRNRRLNNGLCCEWPWFCELRGDWRCSHDDVGDWRDETRLRLRDGLSDLMSYVDVDAGRDELEPILFFTHFQWIKWI